jgi:sugar phosphate isomerase/epimerase
MLEERRAVAATELCWGTVQSAPIETLVRVASENGFESVTVTPWMGQELLADPARLARIRAGLAAADVRIGCLDALIKGLPGIPATEAVPPEQRLNFTYGADACLRVAEALDIRLLNIAHYLGQPVPLAALVDAIGAVAERAGTLGMALCVEFIPGSGIPDLATAVRISAAAGSNVGILVDTWHFARTGGTPAELRELAPGSVRCIQVNDRIDGEGGPVEGPGGPVYPTMANRRLPGDGELPLAELVGALLANSPGVPVGIEVFSDEMRSLPAQTAAHRAAAALRRILPETPA